MAVAKQVAAALEKKRMTLGEEGCVNAESFNKMNASEKIGTEETSEVSTLTPKFTSPCPSFSYGPIT